METRFGFEIMRQLALSIGVPMNYYRSQRCRAETPRTAWSGNKSWTLRREQQMTVIKDPFSAKWLFLWGTNCEHNLSQQAHSCLRTTAGTTCFPRGFTTQRCLCYVMLVFSIRLYFHLLYFTWSAVLRIHLTISSSLSNGFGNSSVTKNTHRYYRQHCQYSI